MSENINIPGTLREVSTLLGRVGTAVMANDEILFNNRIASHCHDMEGICRELAIIIEASSSDTNE